MQTSKICDFTDNTAKIGFGLWQLSSLKVALVFGPGLNLCGE